MKNANALPPAPQAHPAPPYPARVAYGSEGIVASLATIEDAAPLQSADGYLVVPLVNPVSLEFIPQGDQLAVMLVKWLRRRRSTPEVPTTLEAPYLIRRADDTFDVRANIGRNERLQLHTEYDSVNRYLKSQNVPLHGFDHSVVAYTRVPRHVAHLAIDILSEHAGTPVTLSAPRVIS